MKHWYYIEDCTSSKSEIYDESLTAETATEAFITATGKWASLTKSDRAKRDEAYIGFADTDEDGCLDYNTMTEVFYLKRNRSTVYYLLKDPDGYGSASPICTDAVETARLLEEWEYSGTDNPLSDKWHEASRTEIAKYGTYDA